MRTDRTESQQPWFWLTLFLSCITIAAVAFSLWELLEYRFFKDADYVTLHYLYISRGIVSSVLLAFWAAWYVIRQRRRTEDELRESRERYRNMLELAPNAVAVYDSALRVHEWNASAERLYGYSKAEMLGAPIRSLPPTGEEELRALLRSVSAGGRVHKLETLRCDNSGACFAVELSLVSFRESNGELRFVEVTADIRERVRFQQRLVEIEMLTSMGRMAAGTAHHLNTPLGAMLLRVQMMRRRESSTAIAGDLERIESGIRFCQHFVQRLLQFSRRAETRKRPEMLPLIVDGVASFLAPAVLERGAVLRLDLEDARHQPVLVDRNQIELLLHILLSNALDAVQSGGTVAVTCSTLSPESVELRVADDGCGIEQDRLERIFEPFFTTKPPGKGTGLGLAIARNIAVEHGGSIRIESAPGKGATVVVEFPCQVPISAGQEVRT